jgi:hypothetical protein
MDCGGILVVMAIVIILLSLFVLSPPKNEGRRTKNDTRPIYATVTGAVAVAALVWAPIKTRAQRALLQRGRLAMITEVSIRPLGHAGARPVRVSYLVEGRKYILAQDLPEHTAAQVHGKMQDARTIYDPRKPTRADILSPAIARLRSDDLVTETRMHEMRCVQMAAPKIRGVDVSTRLT